MNNHTFAAASIAAALLLACVFAVSQPARAASPQALHITINKNGFEPSQLRIPAGEKVKVMVHNKTALPAEFESYDMTVEKVVPGHTDIPVYIGPLKPGTYKFFNDFAQNVTGKVIVE
jgi:plastocyanin